MSETGSRKIHEVRLSELALLDRHAAHQNGGHPLGLLMATVPSSRHCHSEDGNGRTRLCSAGADATKREAK